MLYAEQVALERKIRETQEAIAETAQIEDTKLRITMSSELKVRLAELLKAKGNQEFHCVSGESINNISTVAIEKAQDTFSEAAKKT